MNTYWQEFTIFAMAHLFSLVSPGPDFLMTVRTSLRHSRKSAILVALGISLAELVHVSYSIIGISLVIKDNPWIFMALKYFGSSYLFYIGMKALRTKSPELKHRAIEAVEQPLAEDLSSWRALGRGFLTNALNVKAAFFTISFFSVLVSPETPSAILFCYAIFIQVSTFTWFALVALILTDSRIQTRFLGLKHWIERCCGALLVGLSIKLALSDL